MHKGKYVFAQLLDFIDKDVFLRLANYLWMGSVQEKKKKFWGTSENAVRIQIYSAIIAYCMIAIVQKKMNIERSIYEMLQIVSISLTDTANLKDLFAKPNYNIVNELDGSTEPSLF